MCQSTRRRQGSARYFTVTGNRLPNTAATIEHRDSELARLHAEIFGTDSHADSASRGNSRQTTIHLNDQQLIAKARRAKNGDAFARLWNGDTTAHNGNHSDADLALCSHLAFWTGRDAAQIDRLFRQSGLMRRKWDDCHSARRSVWAITCSTNGSSSAHCCCKRGAAAAAESCKAFVTARL